MLWQTDATPYEWLGREFGRFALHAVIDDATSMVTGAVFTRNECAEGYSLAMREGIVRYGVPMGIYTDKHTIFRSPQEKLTLDEELDGVQIPLSNFGKAMVELGIQHIKANTPQAKGRIERLWETLQDRLPVELRLLGIKSMEEANEVLPSLIKKHNEKYAVRAAEEKSAYTPLGEGVLLEYVFSMRVTRKIGAGNSISYKNGIYVPDDGGRSNFSAKTVVEVRESYGGEVIIWNKGEAIKLRKLERPVRQVENEKIENKKEAGANERKGHKPPPEHPWRNISKKWHGEDVQIQDDNLNAAIIELY
jgi:hypothetical protein